MQRHPACNMRYRPFLPVRRPCRKGQKGTAGDRGFPEDQDEGIADMSRIAYFNGRSARFPRLNRNPNPYPVPRCPTLQTIGCLCLLLWCSLCVHGQFSGYRIRYVSSKPYFTAHQQLHTSDQGTVVAGRWGDTEYPSDLLVMKLDAAGGVRWSKRLAIHTRLHTFNLCELGDGSIAFAGDVIVNNNTFASNLLLARFSCQGELLWSKTLCQPGPPKEWYYTMGIKPGKGNDFLVSFFQAGAERKHMTVCRIDGGGSLVWSRTFTGDREQAAYPAVAYYTGNGITVFGHKNTHASYSSGNNPAFFALRLNYENGTAQDARGYHYSDMPTGSWPDTDFKVHFNTEQLADGGFALFGVLPGNSPTSTFYYRVVLNTDLSVRHARYYSVPSGIGTGYAKMSVFPNGQTNFISSVYDRQKIYWYAEDAQGRKVRETRAAYPIPNSYVDQQYRLAHSGHHQSMLLLSIRARSKGYIELTRVDEDDAGFPSCMGEDTAFVSAQPWQVTPGPFRWTADAENELVLLPRADALAEVPVDREIICAPALPAPAAFAIRGDTTVCAPALKTLYTARTKNGRQAVAQWRLDPARYQSLERLNDSTVAIQFRNPVHAPQTVKLYALTGKCAVVADSLTITLMPAHQNLPDTLAFCASPIRLQPGPGYTSYRWQDGSSDSVYTVLQPGLYRVQLGTACNTLLTDSVRVLGPTTGLAARAALCAGDTLTLTAPAGFADYSWAPGYNLVQREENRVRVYPDKDTFYVLSATTAEGCSIRDTIAVTLNTPRPVGLGKDITLCSGDAVTLQAGSGFRTYNWNNGTASAQNTVQAAGTYSVQVTDHNNCRSADTVVVTARPCTNSIHIPTAFSPNNDGRNDLFRARVEGRVEVFELKVFNRWGAVVFATRQPDEAWNGHFKGLPQNGDVYIWQCTYQFRNEAARQITGNLTLLR